MAKGMGGNMFAKSSLVVLSLGFIFAGGVQAETPIPRAKSSTLPVPTTAKIDDKSGYPLSLVNEGLRLPPVADAVMKTVLDSKRTIFYKLPRVYQQYNPPSQVEHRHAETGRITYTTNPGNWGIYYSSFLPDFNGNHAFPWEGTFGLNHAVKENQLEKRYGSINMLSLPTNDQGAITPIVILNERPIKWIFPVGTVLGEILWVRDEQGKKWIYEIRCRRKQPGALAWDPIILRPVKNRAELLDYLNYPANWHPPKTYLFLRNTHEDEVAMFQGLVERLPKLTPDQVRHLLSSPFVDVTYEAWSKETTAPTSEQDFSLVPKDYSLGLISADEVSCAQCHRQTQTSLWNLIPREPLIYDNPEKVANIRGSDGIFSWHPFSEESVSDGTRTGQKVFLRDHDRNGGIVKIISNNSDPVDLELYRLTKYVQEALKPYELPRDKRLLH